jgi:PKD domain-containing protein
MARLISRFVLAATAVSFVVIASPIAAAAATNDNFGSATVVGSLPFTDTVDTTGTTNEAGEPQFCSYMGQTVWYTFTLGATQIVKFDNNGTGFVTNINVYQVTGPGFGGLSFMGCSQNPSPLVITAQAGTTYAVQTGILFGASGNLTTNIAAVPAPANDNFASAVAISSLPFSDTQDTTGATLEAGEPSPSCFGAAVGTVWYSFTPTTTETVSATGSPYYQAGIVAYSGSSLSNLTQLPCGVGGITTFRAQAGQTYYFQVAGSYSQRGVITFNLALTPPPVVQFFYYPGDPSIYDRISFYDQSYDPGNLGFASQVWSFGDGGTASGSGVLHQYAADGDYIVRITDTTPDGRTGSASQTIHVRTHDVAVTKLTVPQSASAGQTRKISVGLSDLRYSEVVQVQLFISTPNGFVLVGTLTQTCPITGPNKSIPFDFSYTFTKADAQVGSVTFMATATIIGARDALTTNNTVIALPTKVS